MNYAKNVKLFPFYKMFSYDVLFYYGISILYLTEIKDFSASQVLLLGAIYSIVSMIIQIPAVIISDKIGLKQSIVIGNLFEVLWCINLIFFNNFWIIAIGEIFVASGYALKNVSEFPYTFKIMQNAKMENEVTRVEGKGSALYFVFEAVACVVSGFLFQISPYLPVIFAGLCALTATLISLRFINLPVAPIAQNNKDYFEDLKNGFKFIFKSSRLKSILLFACTFFGILSIASTFSKVYLNDLNISSISFGFIFAGISIIAAIGSRLQRRLEKITKNKTLTYISIIFMISFISVGLAYVFKLPTKALLVIGVIMFGVQAFLKGGYRIIIKNYLNNFTSSAIRKKIFSIYYLIEQLGSGVALLIASEVLQITNIGFSFLIIGLIFLILVIICIIEMKTRCGLKMEEYDECEIKYTP